jgi:GntR family transcriptional regulator, transcriptional repressor for pyruvate dehydrogenase complex
MTEVNLKGLRVPKASDVLANRLRHQILEGELKAGQLLPPERMLAEQSGMSRTVVREALRILEIEGLVDIRPGRNGGSLVRAPDVQSVARSLDIFVRGSDLRFRDVLEARVHLEPICALMAAERRTEEDLKLLDEATAAMEAEADNRPEFLSANTQWHVVVAQISHNDLLSAFMHAIGYAVRASTDIEGFSSPETVEATIRAHRRVVSAIKKGDGEAARKAMQRHLDTYYEMAAERAVPVAVENQAEDAAAAQPPRRPARSRAQKPAQTRR